MADNTELQTLYAQEFTENYEQKQAMLRGTVTTKGEVKGNTFIFIIEGLSDAPTQRTAGGLIPVAQDTQSNTSVTLQEWHHLARKTGFNIASSSVDQRLSMSRRGVNSINYKTDQLIIDQLATTSYVVNSGSAIAMANGILEAGAVLDENFVQNDGERYCIMTPKAWALLMTYKQFTSVDWVPDRPFMKYVQWRIWNGIKCAVHPNLPGKGTATASCFVWHKGAVGHALNKGDIQTKVGQNDEHDYAWARATSYQNAKLVLGGGVVKIVHNDTTAISLTA